MESAIYIIVIIIILLIFNARAIEHRDMCGFWSASAEFCDEAELESATLYLGSGLFTKDAYIIFENAEGIIVNNPIDIKFGINVPSILPYRSHSRAYKCGIDWLGNKPECMPSSVVLVHYPILHKIVMHSGDEIIGIFYKNLSLGELNPPNSEAEQSTKGEILA